MCAGRAGTDPGQLKDKLLVTRFFPQVLGDLRTRRLVRRLVCLRVLGVLQFLSSSSNKGDSPYSTLFVAVDCDNCSSDVNTYLLSCDRSGSALPRPSPPCCCGRAKKAHCLVPRLHLPKESRRVVQILGVMLGRAVLSWTRGSRPSGCRQIILFNRDLGGGASGGSSRSGIVDKTDCAIPCFAWHSLWEC